MAINITATDATKGIRFCGTPGFCDLPYRNVCRHVVTSQCSQCDFSLAVAYLVIAVLLAISIFVGNGLIIWSVLFGRTGRRSCLEYVRLSLSFSDILMGVHLCTTSIPNLVITLNLSASGLAEYSIASSDTAKARTLGVIFILSYTNSMYHLMVISAYRLLVIKWPLWVLSVGNRCIIGVVLCAWLFALGSAMSAVFFNTHILFSYIQSNFIYLPALRPVKGATHQAEPIFLAFACLINPYIGMTILLVATIAVLHYEMRKAARRFKRGERDKVSYKREVTVIKTICFMYLGFTTANLPFCVIVLYEYLGNFSCQEVGLPLMITTLLASSNSLVNVAVSSFRDRNFQKSINRLYLGLRERLKKDEERPHGRSSNNSAATRT